MSQEIIALTQEPIIAFSLLEATGKQVQERISALNIETMEVSEVNHKGLKTLRSTLSKEYEEYELKRKMIKERVLAPYNEFEESYKKFIAAHFKSANLLLKEKVATIEDRLLEAKSRDLQSYLDTNNSTDLPLNLDKLGIKFTRSTSDTKLKKEIYEKISQIKQDLETISTLVNSTRVLAKYRNNLDLGASIADVTVEMEQEALIEAQRAQRAQEKEDSIAVLDGDCIDVIEVVREEPKFSTTIVDAKTCEELFSATFTVTATKNELLALKNYMKENNLSYTTT